MKYLMTLWCALSVMVCTAQQMELSKLKSFIALPAKEATDQLTSSGWTIHDGLSGIQGDQMYRTFSFGNLNTDKAKALAWFRIHADKDIINQLYYQSPGKEQFNLLLAEIIATGAKRKEEQTIDNKQIGTYYIADDFIYQTIVGANSYSVMLIAN